MGRTIKEGMEGELLTKRADALRVEGIKRKGRPRLRWENYVKRYLAERRMWRIVIQFYSC